MAAGADGNLFPISVCDEDQVCQLSSGLFFFGCTMRKQSGVHLVLCKGGGDAARGGCPSQRLRRPTTNMAGSLDARPGGLADVKSGVLGF